MGALAVSSFRFGEDRSATAFDLLASDAGGMHAPGH
jgi:hypothetical protein